MEQSGINEMEFNTGESKVLPSGRKEKMHKYELWDNWPDGVSKEKETGAAVIKNWVQVTKWKNKSDAWQS